MQTNYTDILDRIAEPPLWWDELGVPRYVAFSPWRTVGSGDEIVLLLIACQECGREFRVAMSDVNAGLSLFAFSASNLKQQIEAGQIHYGDPPVARCCGAGLVVGSVPLRVLEFWQRSVRPAPDGRGVDPASLYHVRDPAWEIAIRLR